jgi:hypothetical protein
VFSVKNGKFKEGALLIRKLFPLIFIVFLSEILMGEEINTVDKSSTVDISLNGGLTMKFSDLGRNNGFAHKDTSFAYLLGFKAAAVFNKSWYVGGAGYFLGNGISYECIETYTDEKYDYRHRPCHKNYSGEIQEGDLSLGYGGLIAGYTFNIKNFFRIETGALIGGGRFSAENEYGDYYYKEPFFALEPEINFLFVITRFLAASVNVSYRLITGMDDSSGYSTGDMSGPAAGLDIRFGSF